MKKYQDELVEMLLKQNNSLSVARARSWVELMWEDFETTYAKSGREYLGEKETKRIVEQWVLHYGHRLHDLANVNKKYAHLLDDEEDVKH